MFVLRYKPTGQYERYTPLYDPNIEWIDIRGITRKGCSVDLTSDINEAKTYGAKTSCQNSSAWKAEDYEFVEIQVSITTNTLTSNKK